MEKVTVSAPAHLHAGNFDLTGDLGRLYGTVGFAIDLPLEVEVSKAKGIKAEDKSAYKFAKRLVDEFDLEGAEVKIKNEIPRFVGVGFHTTLALSIGVALSKLYDLNLTVEDVSLIMGRGTITAMGVYAFKTGGFIVEGGFKVESRTKMVPPLIFHGAVPKNWFFVIAIPNESRQKIAQMRENEDEILGNLKLMPKELSDELSRIVLVKLMPAFVEKDLKSFGEALTSFNQKLGRFWRDYQEGTYCNQVVEEGVRIMLREGSMACQTSWGPTFYTIVNGKRAAEKLAKELTQFLDKHGGGEIYVTRANNRGATVLKA
ncbi:MAG: beta-ribofuranosylaminobenzene 5'-phosphate synthase family protein [Candidatus Bathyarchaeia archaeon]|jgi:beta-ribofuranosylaminobenzene 5'-phosphate synthase